MRIIFFIKFPDFWLRENISVEGYEGKGSRPYLSDTDGRKGADI